MYRIPLASILPDERNFQMPHHLKARLIDQLSYRQAGNKADYYWDDTLKGFGVRVYPSGRKSFVATFRENGGKKIEVIGKCDDMSLNQARSLAEKIIASSKNNTKSAPKDVSKTGQPIPASDLTVRELSRAFIKKRSRPDNPSWKMEQWFIDRFVIPSIGNTSASKVGNLQIKALHDHVKQQWPEVTDQFIDLLERLFASNESIVKREDYLNPVTQFKTMKNKALRVSASNATSRSGEQEEKSQTPIQKKQTARFKLLFAAQQLTSKKPFHRVQISEITTQAGMSTGSFYRHFKDKEDILYELLDQAFTYGIIRYQEIGMDAPETDPHAKFQLVSNRLLFLFDYQLSRPGLFLSWYRYGRGVSEKIDDLIHAFAVDCERLLEASLVASQLIKIKKPGIIAQLMIGMVFHLTEQMIVTGKPNLDEAVMTCSQFIGGGLLSFNPPKKAARLLKGLLEYFPDGSGKKPLAIFSH